jgi:hypothetical protein
MKGSITCLKEEVKDNRGVRLVILLISVEKLFFSNSIGLNIKKRLVLINSNENRLEYSIETDMYHFFSCQFIFGFKKCFNLGRVG